MIALEAGANSFEIVARLTKLGFTAVVLESQQVGKLASSYFDDDVAAAERIARAYLTGLAKVVWTPDDLTRQRRELLHAYRRAKTDETRAVNELKGYLNQHNIRVKKRNVRLTHTQDWILQAAEWSPLRRQLLENYFEQLNRICERRRELYRRICAEVSGNDRMLGCLRLLGIGLINAFAIVAVVGDVNRFKTPNKLVAYLGLNPGRRKSGRGKDQKSGVGNRGRGDMRSLIIQGAQAVMSLRRKHHLRDWGWTLFARKGNRNVAVAGIARRLVMQLWHLLMGHAITIFEQAKSIVAKLRGLCAGLGVALRQELALPKATKDAVLILLKRIDPNLPVNT